MPSEPRPYSLDDLHLAMSEWRHAQSALVECNGVVKRHTKQLDDAKLAEAAASERVQITERKVMSIIKELK